MNKYEDTYIKLTDKGLHGEKLVVKMKKRFGTAALPLLITLCGDGDFYMQSLFQHFQIRSLVRAAYNVRSVNYAVDPCFLSKLCDRAFWELNRTQMLKLNTELRYLFPDRFDFLKQWSIQYF